MRRRLKGLVFFCSAALLLGLMVSQAEAGVKFGVKGGLALANIKSVPETFEGYSWETKRGLVGGVSLELGLIGGFSLQPEVLYVQKGTQFDFDIGGISGKLETRVDTIEIPLLLKFNLISGGPTIPSFYAGPFVGFITKAENLIKLEGYPTEREDIKDNLTSTEYGLTFGAGLVQSLGLVKITLDARYDLGLSNVIKEVENGPESVKTRTWLFMVGLSF